MACANQPPTKMKQMRQCTTPTAHQPTAALRWLDPSHWHTKKVITLLAVTAFRAKYSQPHIPFAADFSCCGTCFAASAQYPLASSDTADATHGVQMYTSCSVPKWSLANIE